MLPNVSCRQNPLGTEFSTDLNGHRHLDHGLSRLQVVRNQFRAVALGYGWGCGGVGGWGRRPRLTETQPALLRGLILRKMIFYRSRLTEHLLCDRLCAGNEKALTPPLGELTLWRRK